MMKRRRFLTVSAACAAYPAFAFAPLRWSGFALGAAVSLELHGPLDAARAALEEAMSVIRRVEHVFSLYDRRSLLSRLNRDGVLHAPPPDMLALFEHADAVNKQTQGLFDPSVQALWRAAALGEPLDSARDVVDWSRVVFGKDVLRLGAGQALTFNGIAQGYATDLVTDVLIRHGLKDVHVNIGEHAVRGPARRLAISDPTAQYVGDMTVKNGAVASSSPAASHIGAIPHIFEVDGFEPRWSTVTVHADTATVADGLSTALCLAPHSVVVRVRQMPTVRRVVLIDQIGDVVAL